MYIQSSKPINLYTHNALKGAQGWTRRCACWWEAHGEVQSPVYERPKPTLP